MNHWEELISRERKRLEELLGAEKRRNDELALLVEEGWRLLSVTPYHFDEPGTQEAREMWRRSVNEWGEKSRKLLRTKK